MNPINNYNNIKFKPAFGLSNKDDKDMKAIIDDSVKKLSLRAEREVPEYGDFAPVSEKFSTEDNNKAVLKIIYADDEDDKKLRALELDVLSKSEESKANVLLELANKEDILKVLSSEGFTERIEKNIQRSLEALDDGDFA